MFAGEKWQKQITSLPAAELKPGMYVILHGKWFSHPFLKNEFKLTSEKEIRQIRESGFREVQVDFSRSDPAPHPAAAAPPATAALARRPDEPARPGALPEKDRSDAAVKAGPRDPADPPRKWKPEEIVPAELRAALKDQSLPGEKMAGVIRKSTLVLMDRFLEDPSAANLKEAKQGITEVIDHFMSDDETSKYILSITTHDIYTYTHSVNVGFYALLLAKSLFKGSIPHNMREIGAGFFFHDIGKVHIDPGILNKPGRLDEAEMAAVRRHPADGARMLAQSHQLSEEANIIVMQHHERTDGAGYPLGLKGTEIHLYARICSIADVYDALTSERSYKKKLSRFDALKLMHEQMIGHFQTDLFERFVRVLRALTILPFSAS